MSDFPFLDLKRVYRAHENEYRRAAVGCLEGGWYVLGDEVKQFENRFAEAHRAVGGVGVANGTDGLVLALKAAGLEPGDAVITVSFTAIATISAIRWAGFVPILVDIDRDTFTMSPKSVLQAMEQFGSEYRIRAMIPVHLYGHPAPMLELVKIAAEYKLTVIEDCSQAHLASIDETPIGTMGEFGVFSLYPTKNLGAFGDAGIVISRCDEKIERLRLLREYGWELRYQSEIEGYNSRLDEIQAAMLNVRLTYLEEETERRRDISRRYNRVLESTELKPPVVAHGVRHVFHQYTVKSNHREKVRGALKERGIPTTVLYPEAAHKQQPYAGFPQVSLAETDYVTSRIFQLPIYPQLHDEEVDAVIDGLRNVIELVAKL